jgi:hypothetical protein
MGMTVEVSSLTASDADRVLRDSDFVAGFTRRRNDAVPSVSLEKAWHGLHYLLTGDATETTGPLAFIIAGGTDIPGWDGGYGPARLLSPTETSEIHAALSGVDDDTLWSRFDPEAMTEQGVYPEIWDEPEEDLKDEYLMYFNDLKKLVAETAAKGESLLVVLA